MNETCPHAHVTYYHSSYNADDTHDGTHSVCQDCGKHDWSLKAAPLGVDVVDLDSVDEEPEDDYVEIEPGQGGPRL